MNNQHCHASLPPYTWALRGLSPTLVQSTIYEVTALNICWTGHVVAEPAPCRNHWTDLASSSWCSPFSPHAGCLLNAASIVITNYKRCQSIIFKGIEMKHFEIFSKKNKMSKDHFLLDWWWCHASFLSLWRYDANAIHILGRQRKHGGQMHGVCAKTASCYITCSRLSLFTWKIYIKVATTEYSYVLVEGQCCGKLLLHYLTKFWVNQRKQ